MGKEELSVSSDGAGEFRFGSPIITQSGMDFRKTETRIIEAVSRERAANGGKVLLSRPCGSATSFKA